MARPKSEEKRSLLLSAATQVFATNGLSASTASITKSAGVAEGTLFIYFKDKADLINSLYEEIKQDLAAAMLSGYPSAASTKEKTRYIWNRYVEWGSQNPERLEVAHKIKVWEGLDPGVREATTARFAELERLTEGAVEDGIFRDIPHAFVVATLSAQAETTMQFMRQNPDDAERYKKEGFEIFWNGISRQQ